MGSFRRTDLPQTLHGATEWSSSPLQTEDGLLDLLGSQPEVKKELLSRANPPLIEGGRPRLPGQWPLAYLLFVASREPTIRRWVKRTSHRTWQRCGFLARPKYDTVHHHFAKLEEHADAFRLAANKLIAVAVRESGGLVGRDVHIDGTEAESNARLYHACEPGSCPQNRQVARSPLAKAPTPMAQESRQKDAEVLPGQETSAPKVARSLAYEGGRKIQLSNGCWYWTSDPTAGVRMYGGDRGRTKKRFWVGFNNMKAIDHYTGAVLATWTMPASINEEKAYPDLLNELIENTGQTPRAVVGDRGLSREAIFKLNTEAGIASVFPWRKHRANEQRETVATDYYDQHGVPLCQKCHGPGRFVRFRAEPTPRLWFECENGCGPGSVVCSRGWRYLVPLWRTEEAYLALRHSHSHYEKAHFRWRDQWLVGPDNVSNRPRRRGIGCQRLRAQAALLLEWLGVCWREGWIGGRRRNKNKSFKNRAQRQLERLLRSRTNKVLDLPRQVRLERAAGTELARARTG